MATGGQYTSTRETTNYARLCRLLTDVCADVLREVIAVYIPEPQLQQSLVANRATLCQRLNNSQKQLLYPHGLPGCSSYALMDISLLYLLIRNICLIPAPKQGWGKDPISRANDNSLASNVDRIRIKRNELSGHSVTASMRDQEFHQHWQEIEDTLVAIETSDLGGGTKYKKAMDDLLQQCIDPEMEQRYASELQKRELAELAELETKEQMKTLQDSIDSSTTDAKIQRLRDYTSNLIKSHRNSRTFHRTQMCDTVLTTLLEQNFLTLKAPAGFGKTTISLEILSRLETKYPDRPVFCIRSPEEWKLVNGLNTPIIVWCDDIFGAANFNSSLLENWEPFLYDMYLRSSSGDVLMLLGTRTHILAEVNQSVKSHDIFQNEHVLDLSSLDMSTDDRKRILINFIKASNICDLGNEGGENLSESRDKIIIPSEIVEDISKLSSVPALGYPQCVKLYTSSKHLIKKNVHFFRAPLEGLAEELKFMSQKDQSPGKYLTLVLALLKGDTIDVDNLTEDNDMLMLCMLSKVCGISPPISPETVKLEADHLTDVYFLYDDRANTYTISHQSVRESLAVVFGGQCPLQLLTYCPLSVLEDLVRTYDYDTKLGEVVLKIRPTMYSVMADRLLSEIVSGHGWELRSHQCLTDQAFLDVLFNSRRQTLLRTALYTRQGEGQYSFLLYVVSYPHAERCQFVERSVTLPGALFSPLTAPRGDEEWVREQVQHALIMACGREHINIVRLLTKAWSTLDWEVYRDPCGRNVSDWRCVYDGHTPLTHATRYDRHDMTTWLLDQNCDATVSDKYGNTVLHYLCLHGNADLLTRVLTRHDGEDIINMTNKVGWTCVHFAALTGRDTMVTELLKHRADVTVETSDTRQTPLQLCLEGQSNHDKKIRVDKGGIKAEWEVFTKYSSKKQFDATIIILSDHEQTTKSAHKCCIVT